MFATYVLTNTGRGLLDELMIKSLYLFSYFYLDVVIGFTQTEYFFTEGVDLEAPLVISVLMGTLRRSVIVNVNTQGGSAVGEDKPNGVDPPTHMPTHTHPYTHTNTHSHTHTLTHTQTHTPLTHTLAHTHTHTHADGSDYTQRVVTLTFDQDTTYIPFPVEILNDTINEVIESFTASLQSDDDDVILSPFSTIVQIRDDDREWVIIKLYGTVRLLIQR